MDSALCSFAMYLLRRMEVIPWNSATMASPSRKGSAHSHAEQCALHESRPGVMQLLDSSARGYAERFGFTFVMRLGFVCRRRDGEFLIR